MTRQLAVRGAGRAAKRGLRDLFGILLAPLLLTILGLVALGLMTGLGWA